MKQVRTPGNVPMPAGFLVALTVAGTLCRVVTGVTSASTTLGTSALELNSSASYRGPSSSHSYDFHPDYPDCNNSDALSYIGDGYCDTVLNLVSCDWDGGDCCVCTCNSAAYYDDACPDDDGECEDPSAPLYLEDSGCQNIPFQAPQFPRCPKDQPDWIINNNSMATALADATLCSGGYFEVDWIGHIDIIKTIHVLNETRLNITGLSGAVADGGQTVQIFLVYNASLILNDMGVVNGTSSQGGAMSLAAGSELFADYVAFNSNNAQTMGGAVYAKSSIIELVSTTFGGNSAEGSGGAIYADGSEISLSGTTLLERNIALYGGALYLENGANITSEGVTTFASNDVFANGGAIGATDRGGGNFGVKGTTIFTNNTCELNGGAIDLTNIYFVANGNVTFSHNSAGSFGGALYAFQVDNSPNLTSMTFLGNTARFGGAVFFSQVRADSCLSSSFEYENISICPSIVDRCRFEGNSASSKGGAIYSDLGSLKVLNTAFEGNSADIGGAMSISGTSYLFNSSFEDNMSTEGGGPAVSNGGVILKMFGLYFSGNGYFCSSDSFMDLSTTSVKGSKYEAACDACNIECEGCTIEDRYSAPVCLGLPDHTSNQDGIATLETLLMDPGYWRATNTSWNILECFNEIACLGGLTGSPSYCTTGYWGPYCSVCSQRYYRNNGHRCSECSYGPSSGSSVLAILGVLAGLLLLLLVYYMILIEGRSTAWHQSIDRFKKILATQSLKTIIVSWQIITQFNAVANVVFPRLYQEFLDVVALVDFDFSGFLSTECLETSFYSGLIAATAGPFAAMVLLRVTYGIALRRNRGSEAGRRIVRRKHVNAAILVAFLVYSSASTAVFRTFVCDSLDNGEAYLRADYGIICTSFKHRAFQIYAGFMIAVYPIGIPVLFAILLFRNHKVLENAALRTYNGGFLQQSTSILWKPYKPSVFYYEVVECGRRLGLAVVAVFVYPDTAAQIAATLTVAFIFALTSEYFNPYNSKWDGWVARIGHVVVVLTMVMALLTKVVVSDEDIRSQNSFAGVLLTAHIAMIILGVAEAVVAIYSVQQNDSPLPRPRINPVSPIDSFPSIHNNNAEGSPVRLGPEEINNVTLRGSLF